MGKEKEEAKEQTEKVTLLGKELELTVKKGGDAVINMRKGDFDSVLADKGVTKEVRETVRKAHDEITADVLKFEQDYLLKANKGKKEDASDYIKSIETRLGAGDGSMAIKLVPHKVHNGKDIKSGKPYTTHKFGVATVTLNYQFAAEVRKEGGLLDSMSKAFEKSLAKK